MSNLNSMSYWFPRLEKANIANLPKTMIVNIPFNSDRLIGALDGDPVGGKAVEELATVLKGFAKVVGGFPCFMRTGHTSGKHRWAQTCFVPDSVSMEAHIVGLIESSVSADLMGLPLDCWAVRQMLDTEPMFVCEAYEDFPVVREFRFFADPWAVQHVQPYWPEDAVAEGRPSIPDWRVRLQHSNRLDRSTRDHLSHMACAAAGACGEQAWSVDFLQDEYGHWWLTDMALAADSFRYGTSL